MTGRGVPQPSVGSEAALPGLSPRSSMPRPVCMKTRAFAFACTFFADWP
jgi:hypothetical protein